MQFDLIARERWHNRIGHSGSLLLRDYASPVGWFKRSNYISESQGTADMLKYSDTVRAAAVFFNNTNVTPLTAVPYSLVIAPNWKPWRMLIVSVEDAEAWIDRARLAGATAWWLCNPGPVFEYQPIKHPELDPDLLGEGAPKRTEPYDRDRVLYDIRHTKISLIEIAERYGVCSETVYKLNRDLRKAGDPNARKQGSITIDPRLEQAIIADVLTGQMTRGMIVRKHNTSMPVVTKVVRDHKLTTLPRGFRARRVAHQAYRQASQ